MSIRVVLADDHAVIRDGLKLILESSGDIEVIGVAGNGREAAKLINSTPPDVLIIDITMPEMNGLEAIKEIHRDNPGVKILMLSMHNTSEHIHRALENGAQGYILKKSAGKEVVDAVRTVYNGSSYLSQSIAKSVISDYLQYHKHGVKTPIEKLNDRERQVLQLVVEGRSSSEIAKIIHISQKTVETYRSRLMKKLEVRNVPELVKFAIVHGLTPEA